MKHALEEALARCLARLGAGASIEGCLRGQDSLAEELRPLLEVAQELGGQSDHIPPQRPEAFLRGRVRMRAARARWGERGGRAPWAAFPLSRPRWLLAVTAGAAVLVALAFTTGLFTFGSGTTSAHLEGVVSRAESDEIVFTTADGEVTIGIDESTTVLDAAGSAISSDGIVPGRTAKAEVEEQMDGAFVAQRIEVDADDEQGRGAEVEFRGVVTTMRDSTISVQAAFGVATLRIDSQTEVKGALAVGSTIRVHGTVQGDGSYLAREIAVEGLADDDHDRGHDDVTSDDDGSGRGPADDRDGDDDGDHDDRDDDDRDDDDRDDDDRDDDDSDDDDSDDDDSD